MCALMCCMYCICLWWWCCWDRMLTDIMRYQISRKLILLFVEMNQPDAFISRLYTNMWDWDVLYVRKCYISPHSPKKNLLCVRYSHTSTQCVCFYYFIFIHAFYARTQTYRKIEVEIVKQPPHIYTTVVEYKRAKTKTHVSIFF